MKNADKPVMPNMADYGINKREMFAMQAKVDGFEFDSLDSAAEFIGRSIDSDCMLDMAKASAEVGAKLRCIYADALLAELEK